MNKLSKILDPICRFGGKIRLSKKTAAFLMLAIFVVSVIPIFWMSFYNTAAADDYNFAVFTHQAWEETHSFFAVVKAAFHTVVNMYLNWQGFFSANFIPSLNPFIFNEDLYFITTFVSVLSFTLGFFYLAKQVLRRYFEADGYDIILVACPILMVFFQLMPGVNEWIFWFDAGQAMLFYALTFWFLGMLFKCSSLNKAGAWQIGLGIILSVILSGTSTTSTFLLVFLLFKIINDMFLNKKSGSVNCLNLISFFVLVVGFLVCLIAPGNAVRGGDSAGSPFFKAILLSFFYGFTFMESNITSVTALLLAITPVAVILVPKAKFTFKYPLLILAVSYCIYASRFFSTLYAMSSIGSPRQCNGYFFCEILLFVVNLFYFLGWIYTKVRKHSRTQFLFTDLRKLMKRYSVLLATFVLAAAALSMIQFGVKKTTSISCTLSLVSGQAQQYKQEMDSRLELYLDDSIQDVQVEPVTSIPYVFMEESVTADPAYWKNKSIAAFYGKNSVVLIEPQVSE